MERTKDQILETAFGTIAKTAQELFLRDGYAVVVPFLVELAERDGKKGTAITPVKLVGNPPPKHQMMFDIGRVAKDKGLKCDMIILVSETWYYTVKKEGEKTAQESSEGLPSQHPNRKEALMISARTKDGKVFFELYDILEVGNGKKGLGGNKVSTKTTATQEDRLLINFWRGYEGYVPMPNF